MPAPTPAFVRMYEGRVKWHRDAAVRDLKSFVQDAQNMLRNAERGDRMYASEARNLVASATALVERFATLEALSEVSYFTTDPDAEEKTHGG